MIAIRSIDRAGGSPSVGSHLPVVSAEAERASIRVIILRAARGAPRPTETTGGRLAVGRAETEARAPW